MIWLPEREGLARVGLIDFQDAVAGSRAYDLVSLHRRCAPRCPPAMREAHHARIISPRCAAQGTPLDEAAFRAEMAVMAAQRNAKIVGIFARLYKRDGKPRYLSLPAAGLGLSGARPRPSVPCAPCRHGMIAHSEAAARLPQLEKDTP